ncbi:lycopene cyclase domain-containing protein [Microbacterium sp. G2-8]|uniref:lycopene cyclase domain-containing protein n=1 Tax=Microbacterium sp. G2-8 TaxID=2842454 RepID=UPI001C89DA5A|nr:lycopene cyclase domain-containing protein [Microbacterium sp. G2-8]
MTYLLMSIPFIVVGLIVFTVGAVHARGRGRLRAYLTGWAATTVCLAILTAIFDNVMMLAGFFDYGPGHTLGWRLGLMPLEDFLYPVVGALLLAGVRELLTSRQHGARR